MATLYLHIGTMKTGTSALQGFLRENASVLEGHGYAYPYMDVGISARYNCRNGHFLVWNSEDKNAEQRREDEAKVWRAGFLQLAELAKQFDNIILSDETIWNRMNRRTGRWGKLVRACEEIGCRVKVIVYLRRQDMYMQSYWKQIVKSNMKTTKDFMEWINGSSHRTILGYYDNLKKIEGYIGKENMTVRVYERGQFDGGSIFEDFLNHIGLKYTDEYKNTQVTINDSLEGNFIEFKRCINALPGYDEMPDFMSTAIRKACLYAQTQNKFPRTSLFSYEEQLSFMKKYEKGNEKIAREYLARDDGRMFYDPIEKLPKWTFSQDTAVLDLLSVMSMMFLEQERNIAEMERQIEELRVSIDSMYNSAIFRTYRGFRGKIKKND